MAVQVLPPGGVVSMTAAAADRLVKGGNGDAALLYLHLLRRGGLFEAEAARKALGWTDGPVAGRICAALAALGLPTATDFPAEALAEAALSDKKRAGGSITLVIPRRIGHCELKPLPVAELLPVIRAGWEA